MNAVTSSANAKSNRINSRTRSASPDPNTQATINFVRWVIAMAMAFALLSSGCSRENSSSKQIFTTTTEVAGPLSAHFEVENSDLILGELGRATVIINNQTGSEIDLNACALYVVAPTQDGDPIATSFLTCVGTNFISLGISRHDVTFSTRVPLCSREPSPRAPTCLPGGLAPLLPAGAYNLTAQSLDPRVPIPSPVQINLND